MVFKPNSTRYLFSSEVIFNLFKNFLNYMEFEHKFFKNKINRNYLNQGFLFAKKKIFYFAFLTTNSISSSLDFQNCYITTKIHRNKIVNNFLNQDFNSLREKSIHFILIRKKESKLQYDCKKKSPLLKSSFSWEKFFLKFNLINTNKASLEININPDSFQLILKILHSFNFYFNLSDQSNQFKNWLAKKIHSIVKISLLYSKNKSLFIFNKIKITKQFSYFYSNIQAKVFKEFFLEKINPLNPITRLNKKFILISKNFDNLLKSRIPCKNLRAKRSKLDQKLSLKKISDVFSIFYYSFKNQLSFQEIKKNDFSIFKISVLIKLKKNKIKKAISENFSYILERFFKIPFVNLNSFLNFCTCFSIIWENFNGRNFIKGKKNIKTILILNKDRFLINLESVLSLLNFFSKINKIEKHELDKLLFDSFLTYWYYFSIFLENSFCTSFFSRTKFFLDKNFNKNRIKKVLKKIILISGPNNVRKIKKKRFYLFQLICDLIIKIIFIRKRKFSIRYKSTFRDQIFFLTKYNFKKSSFFSNKITLNGKFSSMRQLEYMILIHSWIEYQGFSGFLINGIKFTVGFLIRFLHVHIENNKYLSKFFKKFLEKRKKPQFYFSCYIKNINQEVNKFLITRIPLIFLQNLFIRKKIFKPFEIKNIRNMIEKFKHFETISNIQKNISIPYNFKLSQKNSLLTCF
jgi:hypothetical protein